MVELKCKVVGLSYHKVDNPVTSGDTVYLIAESNNEFDNDAIAVYNGVNQKIGYVASDKTLSPQNYRNGSKSNLELQFELNFETKKYNAVVDRAFSSCLYLEIDSDNCDYVDETIVDTDVSIINELKTQIDALIIDNEILKSRVDTLESLIGGGK